MWNLHFTCSTCLRVVSFAFYTLLGIGWLLVDQHNLPTAALNCYQCDVEGTTPCPEVFNKPCPRDQAYDRCMAQITTDPSGREVTRRTCALAPCYLRDPALSKVIDIRDNCNKIGDDTVCYNCCLGDGCNKHSSAAASIMAGKSGSTLLCGVALLLSASVLLFL